MPRAPSRRPSPCSTGRRTSGSARISWSGSRADDDKSVKDKDKHKPTAEKKTHETEKGHDEHKKTDAGHKTDAEHKADAAHTEHKLTAAEEVGDQDLPLHVRQYQNA